MTAEIENRLYKFLFPVTEKKVFFEDENSEPSFTEQYKAIAREDNGKLISIMNDSYKIVPNRDIIMPLMDQLHNLDNKWIIDPSHSFVSDQRMRLQVTFPDLTFFDGRSDIALSLFLHNSYDGSEGVRLFWGAIRGICSNGMVFGTVLAKFYARHTNGIRLDNLKQQVEQTYDQIPVIKQRIEILQNLEVGKSLLESVEHKLGKKVMKHVTEQPPAINQWVLYNYLTWYISHVVDLRMRSAYQLQVSKLFKL